MAEYDQVGYIITGQEEQRDEATGYVQRSWPTIEIYRCPTCGALVTDTAFHSGWHDSLPLDPIAAMFEGERIDGGDGA